VGRVGPRSSCVDESMTIAIAHDERMSVLLVDVLVTRGIRIVELNVLIGAIRSILVCLGLCG
jgi:hypothetical protein